jgi:hypothetical protein
MAQSCKQQQERVEETVLQPIDQWVTQQQQKCQDQPCNWWMLCLNKLVCWVVVALVKVALWVTTLVVRWLYRMVCTVVMLVVGLLALLTGNTSILVQAVKDFWELIKDGTYAMIGLVFFVALRIVDLVQSALGVQPGKRHLTERERSILWPIFRDSLNYDAIELVVGPAGILTVFGTAFTMGFTIYLPTYSEQTLVHECVHTWQFEFRGFQYIGNSALTHLDSMVFHPGYDEYDWKTHIDAGDSWYTLKSVEAQAQFIEDVYASGGFDFNAAGVPDDVNPGAFFKEDAKLGHNVFTVGPPLTLRRQTRRGTSSALPRAVRCPHGANVYKLSIKTAPARS